VLVAAVAAVLDAAVLRALALAAAAAAATASRAAIFSTRSASSAAYCSIKRTVLNTLQ
jgi:hypothetical protein